MRRFPYKSWDEVSGPYKKLSHLSAMTNDRARSGTSQELSEMVDLLRYQSGVYVGPDSIGICFQSLIWKGYRNVFHLSRIYASEIGMNLDVTRGFEIMKSVVQNIYVFAHRFVGFNVYFCSVVLIIVSIII